MQEEVTKIYHWLAVTLQYFWSLIVNAFHCNPVILAHSLFFNAGDDPLNLFLQLTNGLWLKVWKA